MAEVTWLLKTRDALYGPESEERLISWAKAGKIQPGQSISSDGEEWTPVTEVPFLDMRWSIDIQDGKPPRGPFHREAVDALLARGRLPENVKIIEVREPWPSDELILDESNEDQVIEKDYIIDDNPIETTQNDTAEMLSDETSLDDEASNEASLEIPAPVEETPVEEHQTEEPPAEEPSVNGPPAEEPPAEEPPAEEPSADEPMAEEAPAEKPSVEKPSVEEPPTKEQPTEEQIAEEQPVQEKIIKPEENTMITETASTQEASAPQSKQMDLPNIPPDASILYGLMREEAESLAKLIADETRETEEFRKASQARRDRMQERRQSILRLIGSDADDMVRRARITHPTITRDANLRQDYNALRLLQERVTQEAKNKIDILTDRLNKSESEARRLRQQLMDSATLSKQLVEIRETLQRREKEIMAERQRFEEERQRFAMERQTLMARLSALESGLPGGTAQSREARGVKLAPWMGLIK